MAKGHKNSQARREKLYRAQAALKTLKTLDRISMQRISSKKDPLTFYSTARFKSGYSTPLFIFHSHTRYARLSFKKRSDATSYGRRVIDRWYRIFCPKVKKP